MLQHVQGREDLSAPSGPYYRAPVTAAMSSRRGSGAPSGISLSPDLKSTMLCCLAFFGLRAGGTSGDHAARLQTTGCTGAAGDGGVQKAWVGFQQPGKHCPVRGGGLSIEIEGMVPNA